RFSFGKLGQVPARIPGQPPVTADSRIGAETEVRHRRPLAPAALRLPPCLRRLASAALRLLPCLPPLPSAALPPPPFGRSLPPPPCRRVSAAGQWRETTLRHFCHPSTGRHVSPRPQCVDAHLHFVRTTCRLACCRGEASRGRESGLLPLRHRPYQAH